MKDDRNEQVEEDSGHIFRSVLVKVPRLDLLICQKTNQK